MSDSSYQISIKVTEPTKIGDGIKAYVRYTVATETDLSQYGGTHFTVYRRFREFHALYERLVDLHRDKGLVIAHPPEKSITISSRVKTTSKNLADIFSIELRKHGLETFINRLVQVPALAKDPLTVEFLTQPVTSVKARDNLIKLRENLSHTFSSLIPETEEYDKWYESKVEQTQLLEHCLHKLYNVSQDLYIYRKELVDSYKKFTIALADLRSAEHDDSVGKAYTSIIHLKEKACELTETLCVSDIHYLIGANKDYLDDFISVKHLFTMYTKKCSELKSLKAKITKLKEKEQKLSGAGTTMPYSTEVGELEKRLEFNEKALKAFYETMKEGIEAFDTRRCKDTRESFLKYLYSWKEYQLEMIKAWEGVIPTCQAIE